MTAFLTAVALAITLEGIAYAAFPEQMKKAVAALLAMPLANVRIVGLIAAAFGLFALWLVRTLA